MLFTRGLCIFSLLKKKISFWFTFRQALDNFRDIGDVGSKTESRDGQTLLYFGHLAYHQLQPFCLIYIGACLAEPTGITRRTYILIWFSVHDCIDFILSFRNISQRHAHFCLKFFSNQITRSNSSFLLSVQSTSAIAAYWKPWKYLSNFICWLTFLREGANYYLSSSKQMHCNDLFRSFSRHDLDIFQKVASHSQVSRCKTLVGLDQRKSRLWKCQSRSDWTFMQTFE